MNNIQNLKLTKKKKNFTILRNFHVMIVSRNIIYLANRYKKKK